MVERKIPKDEVASFLIKEILNERKVNSQRELADEVIKKLKKRKILLEIFYVVPNEGFIIRSYGKRYECS